METKGLIRTYSKYSICVDVMNNTELMGVIDNTNNCWIIAPIYSFIDYFQDENVFHVIDDNEKHLFFDNFGNVIDTEYDNFYGFVFGYGIVEKNDLLYVIDNKCNIVIDKEFISLVHPFMCYQKMYICGQYKNDEDIVSIRYVLNDGQFELIN